MTLLLIKNMYLFNKFKILNSYFNLIYQKLLFNLNFLKMKKVLVLGLFLVGGLISTQASENNNYVKVEQNYDYGPGCHEWVCGQIEQLEIDGDEQDVELIYDYLYSACRSWGGGE